MNKQKIPPLRFFSSEQEYLTYFIESLCKQRIRTHDGFIVRIRPSHFKHAFFENDGKTKKGRFSFYRAKYIDWIKPTLENPVKCLHGWNYKKGQAAPLKRVAYSYQTFIVVIEFRRNKKTEEIEAEFITCFDANRSFHKISQQPVWNPSVLSTI